MRRCLTLLFALCVTVPSFAQSMVMYSYNAAGDRTGRVWGTGSLMFHTPSSVLDTLSVDIAQEFLEDHAIEEDFNKSFELLEKEFPLILTESQKEQMYVAYLAELEAAEKSWWEEHERVNHDRLANTTYAVGAIPFQESVSPSGARLYNIPIETAAGFKLVPSVSLAYNSQAAEGWAGYGWDIQGIPAIRLINKNLYYHEEIKAANATASDPVFALDGVPLVTNSHSATSTAFPLETATGHILAAPEYNNNGRVSRFTVLYPDGTRAIFGRGATYSYNLVYYLLNELQDLDGNKITISYLADAQAGLDRPSSINYGFDANGNAKGEIVFSYETASSSPTRFFAGRQVKYGSRLTSIESRSDGEVLSQYSLTYEQKDNTYLLTKVDCTSGSSALTPIEFTYGTEPSSPFIQKGVSSSISDYIQGTNNIYKRGKFMSNEYRDGILVYPNQTVLDTSQVIPVIPRLEGLSTPKTGITAGIGFQEIEAADVDGDGIDEIVRINIMGDEYNSAILSISVYKCNSSGNPVLQYRKSMLIYGGYDYANPNPFKRAFRLGDFNGDGRDELLVAVYNQSPNQACTFVLVDIASGVVLCTQNLLNYPQNYTNCLIAQDIDSDGRCELCHAMASGFNIYRWQSSGSFALTATLSSPTASVLSSTSRPCYLTDINGDGYMDIMQTPPAGAASSWTAYKYTGSSFSSQTITIGQVASNNKIMFMDINRDGLADLVRVSGTSIYSYRNINGSSFEQGVLSTSTVTNMDGIVPVNASAYNRASSFIKFDGLTVFNYAYNAISPVIRQINGAQDSNGRILHNNYAYLPSFAQVWVDSALSIDASQGYSFRTLPLYVLSQEFEYLTSSYSSLYKSNAYEFYNGAWHSRGLGFSGFARILSRELISAAQGIKSVTDEYYKPEKRGAVVKIVKRYGSLSASPSLTVNNTWDNHSTIYGKLNPRLTKSVTTDALTGINATTEYEYDEWDFPTESKTLRILSGQPNQREKHGWTYQHSNSATKYVLGSIAQEVAVQDLDGNVLRQWKHKTITTFDSLFHPLTRKAYVGISRSPASSPFVEVADSTLLVSETRWLYDSHGNVMSEKSAPYGATTFTGHSYTYDSNGRYMLTDTDPLGHTTTFSGYNKFGKPSSVTDYRSRVTSYTYDNWGNVSSVSLPDGGTEQYTRSWSGAGLYYVNKTASGKPQIIVHYDALDREVRKGVMRFNGQTQWVAREYDRYGRVSKVSLPFRGTTVNYWNIYSYDNYDRPTGIAEASGRQTTWSYSGTSTTTVKEGVTSTSTKDASGNVVNVADAGGVISYTLRDDGQPSALTLTPSGTGSTSVTTTFVYDSYGRRTKLIDPSAGNQTDSYVWNSDGSSQHSHTSPNGSVTTNKDRYGRTTSVQRAGAYNTTYTYNTDGLLTSELSTNNTGTEYTYDNLDRVLTAKESVPDGKWLRKTYTYGTGSNVATIKYTTQGGDITTETYNYAYGNNIGVALSNGTVVWNLVSENDLGMPTQITTGTISREYGFSAYGMPTFRKMAGGSLQNVTYQFNATNGNLTSRTDVLNSQTENFTYDGLNRLVSVGEREFSFDSKGNILSMGGVGSMAYGNSSRPYQITGLAPASTSLVPNRQQSITYTCYDRPSTLTEGGQSASFTYNGDGDRVKMYVANGSAQVLARYYIGGQYEFDQTQSGSKERLYVGGDAYSAPMVLQRENSGSWTSYNIGRDYLGNITQITTAGGTLVAAYSYDPWGRLRDPATLSIFAPGYEPSLFLGRGYTGHEHLTWFGLINMNARLYDPLVGRFLSPDPYVQAPDFTQGFNRYSYALNNPLKYTDPNGEFFLTTAIVIGAAIGMTAGAISGYLLGEKNGATGLDMLGYIVGGGIIGGVAGFAGGAVASIAAPAVTAAGYGGFAAGAITGGLSGAATGAINGFGFSLLGGGSLSDAFQAAGLGLLTGAAIGSVVGGTVEGIRAIKNGNDFWTGKDSNVLELDRTIRKTIRQPSPSIKAGSPERTNVFELNLDTEGSSITLYRGITGSENVDGYLFMTDNLEYAQTYGNGQVVKVAIPKNALEQMLNNGELHLQTGIHMISNDLSTCASHYTEFVFHSSVKPHIVNLFTPL